MDWLNWTLIGVLVTIYLFCLFTVCTMTFAKGYTLLGILGIFAPFLWLVGAILPAKPGSRFAVAEATRYQRQVPTEGQ